MNAEKYQVFRATLSQPVTGVPMSATRGLEVEGWTRLLFFGSGLRFPSPLALMIV